MDLLQMENIIKTQLSVRVPRLLNNSFPTISFTDEESEKTPSFPNVYVHELEPSEVGNDLMNMDIKAIRETIQVEVTTNTSKSDARKVASACTRALKAMSFSINTFPLHHKVNNLYRFVIRASRIIASGDSF